jgi:hypothetical protein
VATFLLATNARMKATKPRRISAGANAGIKNLAPEGDKTKEFIRASDSSR